MTGGHIVAFSIEATALLNSASLPLALFKYLLEPEFWIWEPSATRFKTLLKSSLISGTYHTSFAFTLR